MMLATKKSPSAGGQTGEEKRERLDHTTTDPDPQPLRCKSWIGKDHPYRVQLLNDPEYFWRWMPRKVVRP